MAEHFAKGDDAADLAQSGFLVQAFEQQRETFLPVRLIAEIGQSGLLPRGRQHGGFGELHVGQV